MVEQFPCGGITEICGDVSSGKTAVAYAIIAAALRAGGFVAWIDVSNMFDPRFAREAGIDVDRVLWVAPVDDVAAVRAAEHVLDAGGFRVVVLDLAGRGAPGRSRLSMAAWWRINRAAALRHAAIIVLDAVRSVGTFAMMSLEISADRRVFAGEGGPCPSFEGTASCVRVRKLKGGSLPDQPLSLFSTKG
ncbi:MAG: hypothetical protein IT293_08895 [Deltaproteobacteria bacterium]|nr:hypothetical protein [Deltaproteobacteria bacterium]